MSDKWKCIKCGGNNPASRDKCLGCNTPRPSPSVGQARTKAEFPAELNNIFKDRPNAPKWEYITLHVQEYSIITSINNVSVGEMNYSFLALSSEVKGPGLISVLKELGKKGWEVVASNPTWSTGDEFGTVPYIIILKRPLV